MARVMVAAIRAGIVECWRELRAIEDCVTEMAEEFYGEDVLHPRVRGLLDDALALLRELHPNVVRYAGPFDLPEPDAEIRATIARIVEHEVRNVPTR